MNKQCIFKKIPKLIEILCILTNKLPTLHVHAYINFFLILSFLTYNFFIKGRIAFIAQLNNIASA